MIIERSPVLKIALKAGVARRSSQWSRLWDTIFSLSQLCVWSPSSSRATEPYGVMSYRFVEFQSKGQLISKGLFGILEFFQKNRTNSFLVLLGKKTEFVRSIFGRIFGLKETLRLCLTFNINVLYFQVIKKRCYNLSFNWAPKNKSVCLVKHLDLIIDLKDIWVNSISRKPNFKKWKLPLIKRYVEI